MREKSLAALIGAVVISGLVGCGGNVVVDGSGGDGGGGGSVTTTGTGPTGTTGSTGTTGTTTTTTTVSPPSYCSLLCNQADIYGCLGGSSQAECQDGCIQVFQQYIGCEVELKGYYDCVIAQFAESCDVGQQCDAQAQKLTECTGGTSPCEEYGCAGAEGYCSCEGECNGKYLVTECKDEANGYSTCSCSANGEYLGTCDQPQQSCGIFESCCTSYFFQKK